MHKKRKILWFIISAVMIASSCGNTATETPVTDTAYVAETTAATEATSTEISTDISETTTTTVSEAITEATSETTTTTVTPEASAESSVITTAESVTVESVTTSVTTFVTTSETTTTEAATTETTTTTTTATEASVAASETTVTEAAEEEIPKIADEVVFDKTEIMRFSSYGIDAQKRENYYRNICKRTDIPIIHITTKGNAEILSREEYVECLVDVIGCEEDYVITAEEAGIRVRGNSTAFYGDVNQVRHNLVPYRIKFAEKKNMLGLNNGAECKSWVLLKSNWNLIMDHTAFELADAIFNGTYYYSDTSFVHLYVNEEFVGVYLLTEQNQVNKNRVDINEPEPDYRDTDIGYFYEINNYAEDDGKPYFVVDYLEAEVTDIQGVTREFVPAEYSIDSDIYSDKQTEFIGKYTNNVFKILYEATRNNNFLTLNDKMELVDANDRFDNAYDAISAVMDVDSVVNMYILYEICHDYDCGEGSFYMAVDFSEHSDMKRLTFTAPWDFNWAYNDRPARVYYAGAFNDMSFVNQYGDRTNPWFVLFMTQEWFKDMVGEKWDESYDSGRIPDKLTSIESYLNTYKDDLNRTDQWGTDNAFKLLEWVTRRCQWLDKEFSE